MQNLEYLNSPKIGLEWMKIGLPAMPDGLPANLHKTFEVKNIRPGIGKSGKIG
jgi:hypothetical protein